MKYDKIIQGKFIERPNRFIAYVEVGGQVYKCHVKNTGRCKELLIPGATVYLEESSNPNRKTKYSLVGVMKGNMMINMDSQAPNKVVKEWLELRASKEDIDFIKPEKVYGESRIDFYYETDKSKAYMEVKGVTLIEDGVARFPDAPTERGIKHIEHLIELKDLGYETYIMFVIQCKGVKWFEPNNMTHRAFGEALRKASKAGVRILAYDCIVTEDSLMLDSPVEVRV